MPSQVTVTDVSALAAVSATGQGSSLSGARSRQSQAVVAAPRASTKNTLAAAYAVHRNALLIRRLYHQNRRAQHFGRPAPLTER